MSRTPLAFALALLIAARASANELPANPLFEPRSVVAEPARGPITLDGVLDEPAWATAQPGERFIQQDPQPGQPSTLHTSFRVLFDDDALYIGVRLDDPAAQAIQAPLGRRDNETNADWCFVEIDSRRDRRTAFSFGINPAGMQVDGMFVNDTSYDASWNAVWQAATRTDARGWTAEYRIPFSVLAFTAGDGATMRWGINVYRSNPHTGEVSNWSPRVPQLAGVVSQFNELVVAAAPHVRRIDVTPYALVQAARGPGTASTARAGADADLGITPGLTLSATVLPDFGQVEADPTQLNLTTFELFQTERRPFFTEGLDAFRFDTSLPLVSRDDSFADEAAFYSRRIGRGAELAVPDGATAPLATNILGAAKLFGRSTSGWRAGVLAAASGNADASLADGTPVAVTAPAASAVARVVRESQDGNAAFGLFASELHRMLDARLADQLTRDASALGADARIRWADQTYEARTWVLASDQTGRAAAITRLAEEPWHNLARVDAPRLHLDPGATQLTGLSSEARLARVGGNLLWSVSARAISPGFDVNGLGFQRNSDWALAAGQWSYTMYPGGALRSWQVGSDNLGVGWSWAGERRAAVVDGYVRFDFANYWDLMVTAEHELSVRSTEWLRGGPALALPPRESVKLSAHTDSRRTTYAGLDALAVTEPGSGSFELSATPSLDFRISDHVAGILAATYSDQVVGWQPVAGAGQLTDSDLPAAPADTYLVGRLHQRTVSLSLETDIAISPQLIVQLYAQPFATVGHYGRYALLADPRADRAADRFSPLLAGELGGDADTLMIRRGTAFSIARPDGVSRTLIASAVARWELRPGSFLTAVWNHRGETATSTQAGRLGGQLGGVLAEPGADVFLIKLGWRFAP
ncbi:MAG TPA: DUF5916 domain-containing protein [Kofleriaceae bacterium]